MISSKAHVRTALALRKTLQARLDELLANPEIELLETDLAALKTGIDAWVLDHEKYADDTITITRVQAMRRTWNPDKLEKLVPRGIFKNLVTFTVVPAKIDAYVRQGKLDLDKIAPAFEETPNAPFTKWTVKSNKNGEVEADSLAEALQ